MVPTVKSQWSEGSGKESRSKPVVTPKLVGMERTVL